MALKQTKYLNPNISGLRPSATLAINERSWQLVSEGKKVYRLGFGQSPFPIPEEVVNALIKYASEKDYLPVKGLPALRKAVASFNRRTIQLQCTAEDVLIGPGSKELIFSAQLAFNGILILPSPSWVSYQPQATMTGKKTVWIPTASIHSWNLEPGQLDQICSSLPDDEGKMLLLNYPNNPTGQSFTAEQLEAITAVARKHNLLIISDEIYGEVHHNGQHISISKFYPEGTIVSGGLSKWCGAGGWRLGTLTFPENYHWMLEALAQIASETYSAVSAPIQYAAVRAFEGSPYINQYIDHSRQILKAVGQYVYKFLKNENILFPSPKGGFYCFPDFEKHRTYLSQKGITKSTELCKKLLEETGVALLPGDAFGRPEDELTTRLSFVDFDGKAALQALEKRHTAIDQDFLNTYCPNIIQACDKIKEWLNGAQN